MCCVSVDAPNSFAKNWYIMLPSAPLSFLFTAFLTIPMVVGCGSKEVAVDEPQISELREKYENRSDRMREDLRQSK